MKCYTFMILKDSNGLKKTAEIAVTALEMLKLKFALEIG